MSVPGAAENALARSDLGLLLLLYYTRKVPQWPCCLICCGQTL